MSRGKSVDRSGCSLVVEVILIAVSPCLIEVPLADLWDHEIRGAASVYAYRKRYAVGYLALGPSDCQILIHVQSQAPRLRA